MTDNLLQRIQELQFSDRKEAEKLLLGFIREMFPALDVVAVELQPLAVSLNSFNGFLRLAGGERLFFKTHTEPDNVIGEYYRAGILAEAGYPVIQPRYQSTEAGKHILIYDVIDDPSVFDVAWAVENGAEASFEGLKAAQNRADDDLLAIYHRTLGRQTAQEAADAPVHQLFYLRLAAGRMERFYGVAASGEVTRQVAVTLPGQPEPVGFDAVRQAEWVINGQHYSDTLDGLIRRALVALDPEQAGPSVVGHGDAHNGNVFWLRSDEALRMLYFDPAFAGRHDPLLDLVKPLFHNVFAMWMYYPQQKRDALDIRLQVGPGGWWEVTHNYEIADVRHMFLESKADRVLKPILGRLSDEGMLRSGWREYVKLALFCCPFLTMNLADQSRFPPEITLLGLAMCVEMGSESAGERSLIDATLDRVAPSANPL